MEREEIKMFVGEFRWLSNFFPVEIEFDQHTYSSVEHAYQASKTFDLSAREKIQNSKANEAKELGSKVSLRNDWNNIKTDIMKSFLVQKFNNPILKQKLLATNNIELIEGNDWHDNFWGSCVCSRCGDRGKNMLGKLLMGIRRILK